jgi:hypothetical protein
MIVLKTNIYTTKTAVFEHKSSKKEDLYTRVSISSYHAKK